MNFQINFRMRYLVNIYISSDLNAFSCMYIHDMIVLSITFALTIGGSSNDGIALAIILAKQIHRTIAFMSEIN